MDGGDGEVAVLLWGGCVVADVVVVVLLWKGCVFAIVGVVVVRYYESELQAQLIPTHHPKPKPYLINHLYLCPSKQCQCN